MPLAVLGWSSDKMTAVLSNSNFNLEIAIRRALSGKVFGKRNTEVHHASCVDVQDLSRQTGVSYEYLFNVFFVYRLSGGERLLVEKDGEYSPSGKHIAVLYNSKVDPIKFFEGVSRCHVEKLPSQIPTYVFYRNQRPAFLPQQD